MQVQLYDQLCNPITDNPIPPICRNRLQHNNTVQHHAHTTGSRPNNFPPSLPFLLSLSLPPSLSPSLLHFYRQPATDRRTNQSVGASAKRRNVDVVVVVNVIVDLFVDLFFSAPPRFRSFFPVRPFFREIFFSSFCLADVDVDDDETSKSILTFIL